MTRHLIGAAIHTAEESMLAGGEAAQVDEQSHHLAQHDERRAGKQAGDHEDHGGQRALEHGLAGQTAPRHVERDRGGGEHQAPEREQHTEDDEHGGPEGGEAVPLHGRSIVPPPQPRVQASGAIRPGR